MQSFLLDFRKLERAYRRGLGGSILRQLLQLPSSPAPPATLLELTKWLQLNHPMLQQHPEALLQLAFDAPAASVVAQHAHRHYPSPPFSLISKPTKFPPWVSNLRGDGVRGMLCVANSLQLVVVGLVEGQVRVLEAVTWRQVAVLSGHVGAVTAVCITPDNRWVARSP